MDEFNQLCKVLARPPRDYNDKKPETLNGCIEAAAMYAQRENAVAVVSDLSDNKSYVYCGGLAERLGIGHKGERQTVSSVWETKLFQRINYHDLMRKHASELRFFHMMQGVEHARRPDMQMHIGLRMKDSAGAVLPVRHRISYVASLPSGAVWLAQCLYNADPTASPDGIVIDTLTGETTSIASQQCSDILSGREIQILKLVQQGYASKQIADCLFISTNTVSRHRQNILHKLQVANSTEACHVAEMLCLI